MSNLPHIYFITGISGSGKTTVGRELVRRGEVALDSKIQPGLFRFADEHNVAAPDYRPQDQQRQARYKWRLNKEMFDELLQEHKESSRVFLCGGADDLIQYWPMGKKIFLLTVDSQTLLQRLTSEDRDNQFGKDEKTQALLLERLERKQSRLAELGALEIDACQPLDSVVTTILAQLS